MNREKKQLVVVITLVVAILAVGGFQFMGGSTPPPAEAKKEAEKPKVEDPNKPKPMLNPGLYPLPAHDPFIPASFIDETAPDPTAPKLPEPTTPVKPTLQDSGNGQHLTDRTGGGLPIHPPTAGNLGKETVPPMPVPKEPEFGYSVVGIIVGKHPIAVFDDGKGNQQLVEVGQGIGPSAKVLAITRGTVRVKFNAQTLTFNVGGNQNAK